MMWLWIAMIAFICGLYKAITATGNDVSSLICCAIGFINVLIYEAQRSRVLLEKTYNLLLEWRDEMDVVEGEPC